MTQLTQFWIDVGGTFTDCVGVTDQGELRQFKTLSSGLTKGVIERRSGNVIGDALRVGEPTDFWVGATCRMYSNDGTRLASANVTAFDTQNGDLQLDSLRIPDSALRYEIDARLPAPVLAIRSLLRLSPDQPCPAVRVRFGTTRGTNALLTRSGARTALITTQGSADVPLIGNQDRPELFRLDIQKPTPLFSSVFEVAERIDSLGRVLQPLETQTFLQKLTEDGLCPLEYDSVAICLLNAYRNSNHEKVIEAELRRAGFPEVSRSSEVSNLIRYVPRCDTTVLDAYLNPILREYLDEIRRLLPDSEVKVMTSSGGLVDSHGFRGRDCILSGPAGGVVGFAQVAKSEGVSTAIGFDMGGTSTDVARFDGQFEYENETMKAGVRVMTPVLAIETVAAGGGSICGFDGARLFVGPQSAGADPGPACYGAGGPLTITDLNVFLGRVVPEHFPFPLNIDAVAERLSQLHSIMVAVNAAAETESLQDLAEGLLAIANDNMVQAIKKVSVAKGYHPADHALVCFGGAGGQHVCSIARSLGIRKVLIHPFAGILSAYGMGQADVRAIRQTSVLMPLNAASLESIKDVSQRLMSETQAEVMQQGVLQEFVRPSTLSFELRYQGTDSGLMVPDPADGDLREDFESLHLRMFGFVRNDCDIEIVTIRVETIGAAFTDHSYRYQVESVMQGTGSQNSTVWFGGQERPVRVVHREELSAGDVISGPSMLCESTSTIFLEPGCEATISKNGTLVLKIGNAEQSPTPETPTGELPGNAETDSTHDPVLLEVFNNQFVSIAEQMGETLRRTSTSTNVRERLDFSCALFDADGGLVVNAPHVPVHLGAMGETVKAIMADHATMQDGEVFVTNDPYRGGSHLPDVTVVTPVFLTGQNDRGRPTFYVANRAHHAEIGGIAPGSMPPHSKNLAEEGVLIRSRVLVSNGRFHGEEMRDLLGGGPHPSRSIDDNVADLTAQVAANASGAQLLQALANASGKELVLTYMSHIQRTASLKMRQHLDGLQDGQFRFTDVLDDGAEITVCVTVKGDEATVDFTGSSPTHAANLNANKAITTAAVLYVFRCMLGNDVPLNDGVLEPVKIVVPNGILDPSAGSCPDTSPAIVGGNVETSQRIVDVLLGAFELAAASQGTMNNLTFGDESFGYYETICGGSGATANADGVDAVHTHMTNTRLTDPEILEQRYPVRLRSFRIRPDSGGTGLFCGGRGVERELEFTQPVRVSMLSQRRSVAPYGLAGGDDAATGRNTLLTGDDARDLGGSFSIDVDAFSVLRIETPGGGGYGRAQQT